MFFLCRTGLKKETIKILDDIEKETNEFIDVVLNHSTKEMKGKKLSELFPVMERKPEGRINSISL